MNLHYHFDIIMDCPSWSLPQPPLPTPGPAQALLKLHTPVPRTLFDFGSSPFPVPRLDVSTVPDLVYAREKIVDGRRQQRQANGSGGGTRGLGVSDVMIGRIKEGEECERAVGRQVRFMLENVTHHWSLG